VPVVAAPEFIPPALCSLPPSVSLEAGREAVELAASSGLVLDPWQAWAVEQALAENTDGGSAAFEIGIVVGRQNGKGAILEALALAWLFLAEEELILWSAHEFKTAAEAFRRMRILLQGAPDLWPLVERITTANGDEAIELTTGQRLKFVARSDKSGLGFSGDKIILDEAHTLDEEMLAALVPTMATRPDPQMVYTSSAGRPKSHSLRAVRKRALAGGDPSLCWLEWCAPEGADLDDRAAWRAANPGYGVRISEDFIVKERRAMASSPARFGRERLGWWDPEDGAAARPISLTVWAERADPGSQIVGAIAIAADVAPGRASASIAVAGHRADGKAHAELIRQGPGTDWLAGEVARLVSVHEVLQILDGKVTRPAIAGDKLALEPLLADFTAKGVVPVLHGPSQLAAGCARMQDAVESDSLRHLGQEQIAEALAAAVKRDVGDGGWAWGKRLSAGAQVDISGLVALTEAHSALVEAHAPVFFASRR
jgi:hypothetical protein